MKVLVQETVIGMPGIETYILEIEGTKLTKKAVKECLAQHNSAFNGIPLSLINQRYNQDRTNVELELLLSEIDLGQMDLSEHGLSDDFEFDIEGDYHVQITILDSIETRSNDD